ncbi:MAG TPA: DinB family protein [Vicinamibacterales bacterium]|nr:DinB family protein [Vicinamibacterales bacterium]
MRNQLAKSLDWGEAHVDFDKAVVGLPPELRGRRVPGLPHSAWDIVEHLRIAQHDILDFARNPKYQELKWPDAYWPPKPEPPDAHAWDASIAEFRRDREALKQLTIDPHIDLMSKIPHGSGQTYLREVLLVLDHNAYHVGELVALRRLLGAWPA